MRTTYMAKPGAVDRKWYIIDATGQTVGRLASQVATILRGKNKPEYTPHVDTGDFVVIVNSEKVVFTGKKLQQKMYRRHSMYPGGLKEITAEGLLQSYPERVLFSAVKGMLPKNTLGREQLTKLRVYKGSEHPHEAQQPIAYEL